MAAPIPNLSAALNLAAPTSASWLTILPVPLCFSLAAILVILRRHSLLQPVIATAGLLLLVGLNAALLVAVIAEGPVTMVMGRWLPPFGIAFTVDLTSALFTLTASMVALAACLFASGDIDAAARGQGFYAFLLLLMAGVCGALTTGDIFNLYVWFEVTLIAAFGLMAVGEEPEQIDGAWTYALMNLVGTALFLATVGLLYARFGTLNMADLAREIRAGEGAQPGMTLSVLFLFALGLKAAAFPLQMWLPAAYHTPRLTVSALFAGLMTKVAIYVLLRLFVMLMPLQREELSLLIVTAGAASMLVGALGMLAEDDLRRVAGFGVIAGIGNMLSGLALGSPGGISGAILYALHSMLAMTALYIAIAGIGRRLGSFSLGQAGGLYARDPLFAFLCLALFFAVSGLPPLSGFWPKAILTKAALDIGAWWLAGAILLSGFLTTIALARIFLLAFWRPAATAEIGPAASGTAALTLLVALIAGFGLLPEGVLSLAQEAAASLSAGDAYVGSVFPGEASP